MKSRTITAPSFRGAVTLGLERGYTREKIDRAEVYEALGVFQKKLLEEEGIGLSVRVSDCDIVFGGQVEPHLRIDVINYPRFPATPELLRHYTLALAGSLLERFGQYRVVVELDTETVMLDRGEEVDLRVGE